MTTTNIAIAVALGIAAAATLALGWLAIGYHAKQELARQKAADLARAAAEASYAMGFETGDKHGYRQATRIIAADLARIANTNDPHRAKAKLDAYRQLLTRETDQ